MNLQARGRVSEIRNVRSGSLIAYDYMIEDTDARERLSASRSISIFRDVAIAPNSDRAQQQQRSAGQAPCGVASQTPSLIESVRVSIPITRGFPHVYTECAHIWNPVHTERKVALTAGLPDIILHGTATWALAGRELLVAHGCEGRRMNRLAGRFVGHVIPPATLTLRYRPNDHDPASIRFDVLGANGAVVLADGLAEFTEGN
jgi:acyl dehydratase